MNYSDIKFYYSNGDTTPPNCNAALSLGGERSTCELTDLFGDLTSTQSRRGLVDYRCFYVKNTHLTETLREAKLYIDFEKKSGSFIDLGIARQDEVQKIQFTGLQPPAEGDYILIDIPGYVTGLQVDYHVNQTIWQGRMQTEMRSVDGLGGVIVSVAGSIGHPTDIVFTVQFVGEAKSHAIDPMTVDVTNLSDQTALVSTTTNGLPINTETVTIDNFLIAPAGVEFNYPLRGNPVELGNLRPGDELPIWVRRTTPEKTVAKINDSFIMNIDGIFP